MSEKLSETDRALVERVMGPTWARLLKDSSELAALLSAARAEARPAPAVVSVPPMTDDQRAYVAKAAAREPVDLNHVVGGPKARPAPAVDREAVARIILECVIGAQTPECCDEAADAILALLSPAAEPPSRDNAGGGG
jgi:hypothetical protein